MRGRGLLDQFVRERNDDALDDRKRASDDQPEQSPFRESLPELDNFERAYVGEEDEEEDRPNPVVRSVREQMVLPRFYDTESTVVMVANDLGTEDWGRIYSRLRVFEWDPLPEEQIEDLRTWDPPVLGAILGVIESCHRHGEVLNLDYRAVLDAIEALKLGMSWEDALRDSFFTPADEQVQQDAGNILDWLVGQSATAGKEFTDRDLAQGIGSLRGDPKKVRRTTALDYLVARGWIERSSPPRALRPGKRGRRPGMTFRVLALPVD